MRRALIVGINDYPNTSLAGCVSDAANMERVLRRHADLSPNFECRVLTAPPREITRPALREEITKLLNSPAEVAFLHFSGHGVITDVGGFLVTQDASRYDEGMPMQDVLTLANQSPVTSVVITLDCCHSGAFGEIPALTGTEVVLREGISVIASCGRDELAIEGESGGVFTSLVVETLEGAGAGVLGDVTPASVYTYLDTALGAWDQRPLFKLHVSKLTTLRWCEPRIDLEILRLLPDVFSDPGDEVSLLATLSETLSVVRDAVHSISSLEGGGLIERAKSSSSLDALPDLFRLTSLGRLYRRLVQENKI